MGRGSGPHLGAGLDRDDPQAAVGEVRGEDPGASAEIGDNVARRDPRPRHQPIDQRRRIAGARRVRRGLRAEVAEGHRRDDTTGPPAGYLGA